MIRTARFAGWASIASAVVGVLVTPFMASVWESDDVVWSTTEGLVTRVFGPTLESWGALTFGSGDLPYEVYGKFFGTCMFFRARRPPVRGSAERGGFCGYR